MEPDKNNEPQIVKPETMFNPTVSPQRPDTPPQPSGQPAPAPPEPPEEPSFSAGDGGRKKVLTFIAAGFGLFVIIVTIIAFATSGGNKTSNGTDGQDVETSGILVEPTAVDIENANNSISSDITGLNDENDFPESNLSDINLQL
ncbi:MAG TPA: hypothetical protein VFX86_02860 [Candidatus Saccharimonadales bacterium]|nr:hypothetical protein [Candidatus Saccharimonadales bacterium]